MQIPKKLKLNSFKLVDIPKNKDLFARLGYRDIPADQYSGSELGNPVQSKIDAIMETDARLQDELSKSEAPNS